MIEYYKTQYQLIGMFLMWVLIGIYLGPVVYAVVLLVIFLLGQKKRYYELFLGLIFIIVLSDSRQLPLSFAKNIKNIYIVAMALFFLLDTKSFQPISRLYMNFVWFFVLIVILVSVSPTPFITFQKTVSYILLYLIAPNYALRLYRERGDNFLKEFIFFLFTILLAGLLLIPFLENVVFLNKRYCGIFGNPNGIGVFASLVFLLFSAISAFRPNLFSKTEYRIIFLIILASVLLSGSRNSLMTIVLFLLFVRFYKISPVFGTAIFITFLLVYQVIDANLESIVQQLGLQKYLRTETLKDASGRIVAWKFAWEKIQDNFFFGKGYVFDEYIFAVSQKTLNMMGHQGGVHSTYLAFWLNTGIVGTIIYFRGFFLTFFHASKISPLAFPIMFAILFSISFESWLVASLNPDTILFLILLTLLTSLEIAKVKETPAASPLVADNAVK